MELRKRLKAAQQTNLAMRQALQHSLQRTAELASRMTGLVQEMTAHKRPAQDLPEDFFRNALQEVWARQPVTNETAVTAIAPAHSHTSQASRVSSHVDCLHLHARQGSGRARSS